MLPGIDEDAENEDWIELYNAGATTIDLSDFTLSDKLSEPTLWPLTGLSLEPNAFLQIFCSEKNRYQTAPFINAINDLDYTPLPDGIHIILPLNLNGMAVAILF
ncbi:MAG: lamin tail domain-containing protein [Bacteroidetes bacterium]|nr:lamin tail domain-containing protein [Bacteroidota bacterium]